MTNQSCQINNTIIHSIISNHISGDDLVHRPLRPRGPEEERAEGRVLLRLRLRAVQRRGCGCRSVGEQRRRGWRRRGGRGDRWRREGPWGGPSAGAPEMGSRPAHPRPTHTYPLLHSCDAPSTRVTGTDLSLFCVSCVCVLSGKGGAPCRGCGWPVGYLGAKPSPPTVVGDTEEGASTAAAAAPPTVAEGTCCGRCGGPFDAAAALRATEKAEGAQKKTLRGCFPTPLLIFSGSVAGIAAPARLIFEPARGFSPETPTQTTQPALIKRAKDALAAGQPQEAEAAAAEALRAAAACSLPEGAL